MSFLFFFPHPSILLPRQQNICSKSMAAAWKPEILTVSNLSIPVLFFSQLPTASDRSAQLLTNNRLTFLLWTQHRLSLQLYPRGYELPWQRKRETTSLNYKCCGQTNRYWPSEKVIPTYCELMFKGVLWNLWPQSLLSHVFISGWSISGRKCIQDLHN